MASETAMKSLQSSVDIVKTDITLLVIQCRGQAGLLYSKLTMQQKDWGNAYIEFINLLYQLYMVFKYNADKSNKITDWPEKRKIYDLFFEDVISGNYQPVLALRNFDAILEDLINAGIYNLTATEFEER